MKLNYKDMIEEAFISYETAKLMKNKGFDFGLVKGQKCSQQMAMRWLREVHDIDIIIFRHIRGKRTTFFGRVEHKTHLEHQDKCNLYMTYENAVEAALKYCLENLI